MHGPLVDQVLADEKLSTPTTAGEVRWALADHEQSVRRLVKSDGTAVADILYDSFGKIPAGTTTPDAVDFLFGYTGQQYDKETGLSYYKARYYDPFTSHFLSEDPAHDGVNPYRYVGNDPLNRVDPTGLATSYLGGGLGASTSSNFFLGGLGNYSLPTSNLATSHSSSGLGVNMNSLVNSIAYSASVTTPQYSDADYGIASSLSLWSSYDTWNPLASMDAPRMTLADVYRAVGQERRPGRPNREPTPQWAINLLAAATFIDEIDKGIPRALGRAFEGVMAPGVYVMAGSMEAVQNTISDRPVRYDIPMPFGLDERKSYWSNVGTVGGNYSMDVGSLGYRGVYQGIQEYRETGDPTNWQAASLGTLVQAKVLQAPSRVPLSESPILQRFGYGSARPTPAPAPTYTNGGGTLGSWMSERSAVAQARLAGPTGDTYSVAFQTELRSTSYPGVSRSRHFQEANESLLQMMEADQQFAQAMHGAGVNLQRTATGLAPRTSPAGWTWHHAQQPGVLELVPSPQHTPGSVFWETLHPGGRGGYSIWGE